MDLGNNYSEQHAPSVQFIRDFITKGSLDDISWTSDPTPWDGDPDQVHNCFGFAVGSKKFWQPPSIHGDPEGDPRFYWPPELLGDADENTWVSRYVAAAQAKGFSECGEDASLEVEFEKIVLIHSGGVFKHAALQIDEKRWKSKLGLLSDLEHPLEFMLRNPFGKGTIYMKRKRALR